MVLSQLWIIWIEGAALLRHGLGQVQISGLCLMQSRLV